jgi:hypothetical protein
MKLPKLIKSGEKNQEKSYNKQTFMNQLTVTKSLIICSFVIPLLLSGCGNSANSNKAANSNANKANNIAATPTPVSAEDLATKAKIEDALKKAGFENITVDATTNPMAIRGSVAKDKMAEIIFVAQQAAGKDLKNELVEKK